MVRINAKIFGIVTNMEVITTKEVQEKLSLEKIYIFRNEIEKRLKIYKSLGIIIEKNSYYVNSYDLKRRFI